mgnify:CR=1 FL=1
MLSIHKQPEQIAASAWIAETATVVGDVWIGSGSSVWFGAVLRGDVETIRIGQQTNIEDRSGLHTIPVTPSPPGR